MRLLIALLILSLTSTGEGRPSQPGDVFANRYSVSNSTQGSSEVVCRATQWYDVCLFYFTNYIIHALSVRSLPGEGHVSAIGFKFLCLLIPFTGVRRGLSLVVRASNLAKNDLQAAARAGALCMVVRSKDWRPRNGDVLDGCSVEHINADVAGNQDAGTLNDIELCHSSSSEGSSIGKSGLHATGSTRNQPRATICVQSPYKALPNLSITAKLAEFTVQMAGPRANPESNLIADATSIKLHGLCKLALGYELCYVPSDMKVYPYPRLTLRDTTVARLTGDDYRTISKQTRITSSHAFPRMLFSLAQTFSGGYQLYKVRGAQISQFGFAAYGFTVIPYVIVSIINFVGCVLSNEYTSAYVVHSEIMDEMIDRGGLVDGVAGTIIVPKEILEEGDSILGEKYFKLDGKRFLFEGSEAALHCRSMGDFSTETFDIVEPKPAEAIPKAPFRVRCGKFIHQTFRRRKRTKGPTTSSTTITVPSHVSFTRLLRPHFQIFLDTLSIALLSMALCTPWLIIGFFSGFHSNNATQTQMNYAIMWLAAGQFHAYFGGTERKILKKKAWQIILIIFVSYGGYCLGGFIIVAQELIQSGICSDTSLWYLQ